MKFFAACFLVATMASCVPTRPSTNSDFVCTVGTDANGALVQQVEWLYRSADLREKQCPIWAGSLVQIGREENSAVCIQCDKTALPDENRWHQFILKGNVVHGWLRKEAVIKVRMSDWKKNRQKAEPPAPGDAAGPRP
jgi:hypothetical protein